MKVFVYGTLKRGGENHHYLAGQRFIGTAATEPLFRLFDMGGYPGMIADATHGHAIEGEIWDVDDRCLRHLDILEDIAGGEYVREPIPLQPPFAGQDIQGYRYLRSVAAGRELPGSW